MVHYMQNLNGELMCAIDTETTGTDPERHDIVEVAILPLSPTGFHSKHPPFIMQLKPQRPEFAQGEALRVNKLRMADLLTNGHDPYDAAELLVEWFERLSLGINKRIIPIGANYAFDRDFLIAWLGRKTYDYMFSVFFRDVIIEANFQNDRAGYHGKKFPHARFGLRDICNYYKIPQERSHTAVDDARCTALCYHAMTQELYI